MKGVLEGYRVLQSRLVFDYLSCQRPVPLASLDSHLLASHDASCLTCCELCSSILMLLPTLCCCAHSDTYRHLMIRVKWFRWTASMFFRPRWHLLCCTQEGQGSWGYGGTVIRENLNYDYIPLVVSGDSETSVNKI